ncbi:PEP-utilizing enzyme, mobile domain protein [Mycobacterium xenopi 3993]|nr:PEP-utilizing enzyme, mobile domain protein [Mycobacterium xenopi 3993]
MENEGGVAPLTDPIRGTSEPHRLWTLTNVGEATPDILSPLCWALWGAG